MKFSFFFISFLSDANDDVVVSERVTVEIQHAGYSQNKEKKKS